MNPSSSKVYKIMKSTTRHLWFISMNSQHARTLWWNCYTVLWTVLNFIISTSSRLNSLEQMSYGTSCDQILALNEYNALLLPTILHRWRCYCVLWTFFKCRVSAAFWLKLREQTSHWKVLTSPKPWTVDKWRFRLLLSENFLPQTSHSCVPTPGRALVVAVLPCAAS